MPMMEMEAEKPGLTFSTSKKNRILVAFLALSVLVNVALLIAVVIGFTSHKQRLVTEAVCHVRPNPSAKLGNDTRNANLIQGTVKLSQKAGDRRLSVSIDLTGFAAGSASKKHGFHVHQSGDIVTDGCQSAQGHYNPAGKKHGDISDKERHVGDWSNIVVPANGAIKYSFSDEVASLTGKNGVLGRAIVIHQGEDDLGKGGNEGSEKTGNAGKRLACCVIVPEA